MARSALAEARAEALAADRVQVAPDERWQHGQELGAAVAPRMPTSVASGVDVLRRARAIGDDEVTAAERFRRDYVFGVEGVRDPRLGNSAGSDCHMVQLARSIALAGHREIADAIGPKMTAWLVALVVGDLSFAAMQRQFMPGDQNGRIDMRGRMTTILILLSRLYSAIDCKKKRKKTPHF